MKILLVGINSKFIHSNLAIYSLRAYAKEYQEHIELVEYTINQYQEYILQEIYKKQPDVVAFSCYIWNLDYVKDLIIELKKVLPETKIWVGGPEVSYDATAFLEEMDVVTGVMTGEGEATFLEVTKHYVDGSLPLEDIKGITYLSNTGQAITTPPREVLDMDTIPFIYEDLSEFSNRIIYYETSRGCPFTCSYCLSSIKERVRFRSFSLVKEELQFFLDHNVKQVKFVDRTFNANHTHAMNIIQYMKDHDNGITNFHFEIAADIISDQEIELLKTLRPGLVQLEIGVQSTNLQTIEEIDRTMDLNILKNVVNRIQEGNNIHQHLDLIVGLPFEDYHSFTKSFDDVYHMDPNQLQLGFLKLLKGSKMHRKVADYGIVYGHKTPYEVLYTNWITYDDVLQLKAVEEMVEVYYNSGQFLATIKELVATYDSPYVCFYELADYYESHDLNGISHTRIRRYEILLSFIEQKTNLDKEYFKELLLYDLYLRENVKSRPSWATDLQNYKDVFKAFYQEEEQNRKYLVGYEVYNHRQLSKMTHIERFSHHVTGDKKPGTYFVLFDYQNRDPLTYDATTHVIQV